MNPNMPDVKWGGARAGAGRKPTGRIRKTLWLTPEEFKTIKMLIATWRMEK